MNHGFVYTEPERNTLDRLIEDLEIVTMFEHLAYLGKNHEVTYSDLMTEAREIEKYANLF